MDRIISEQITSDLAATLVEIAHERGLSIERLRAEQLLAEARHAWPGRPEEMWSTWLAEAAKCLELRARVARFPTKQALDLVEDGALLMTYPAGQDPTILLSRDGRKVTVSRPAAEHQEEIDEERFVNSVVVEADADQDTSAAGPVWLIVEDLELSHEPSHAYHDSPIARFFALLRPEWSDIWVIGVFAFFAGGLSLATPIAVESLVNIVAFGQLLQPLLILSLMLFGFLAFASMMKAVQTFVVEIIQRRLFVRVAADLAYRFPRVTQDAVGDHYGPELANRFFDIVTLQKVVAHLLLDGLAIVLATAVGMAVLAFYHPWLLGFDVLLLLLVVAGVFVLGKGAIRSGIDESKQKYRLASWLEDLLRCRVGFKTAGAADFALDRANQVTADYLNSRRKHFRVLFRQLLFILSLQVVAGTVLLGFGGWLVIRGQLTLGQLVAAELIVATILASLAKLGKHIEGFYDVIASVDKLGHLFDLQIEPQDGLLALKPGDGAALKITDVCHSKGEQLLQAGFSLDVQAGERMALLGHKCAGSTVLFDILFGLQAPRTGHVEIEDADPRDVRPDVLREAVTLVRDVEIFEGTIAENIQMARPMVSMTHVREALLEVGLLDDVLRQPNGIDTRLNAGTTILTTSQLRLLMLARAIAGRPRLLLIDGLLDGLGDIQLARAVEVLNHRARHWTVMVSTNRNDVADRFERMVEIEYKPHLPPSTPLLEVKRSETLS